jgi:ribosomal protein S17
MEKQRVIRRNCKGDVISDKMEKVDSVRGQHRASAEGLDGLG